MVDTPHVPPEQRARQQIDQTLAQCGWLVQSRAQLNLAAGPGVAVREFLTAAGPADYALFLGNHLVGVLEAKPEGVTLGGVEAQTAAYAAAAPAHAQVPVRPLPFCYESNSRETYFTNGLDPEPRARRVFAPHRPETLRAALDAGLAARAAATPAPSTLKGRMRHAPPLDARGLWPAQIRAVEALEQSVCDGRPRALIQMATGSGKTFTAITALYRLIRHGGARRVLFLVDRQNLGRQADRELQAYVAPDDGRTFSELYPTKNLTHNTLDPTDKVVITTIQRLYSILKGEPDLDPALEEVSAFETAPSALRRTPPPVVYSADLPPDFFDLIVVDECHRSIYTVWGQVLEYFDATVIGLTATPSGQTYGFFNGNVVSEYKHTDAVRDRVNVSFQVYEIATEVTVAGTTVIADQIPVRRRERLTRAERWAALEETTHYDAAALDRDVVVPSQIRTVLETLRDRLFTELFPDRHEIPKTLIFAKSDEHAEDILRILRDTWALSNTQAVKITYRAERPPGAPVDPAAGAAPPAPPAPAVAPARAASHRPEDLISAFRNSYHPRVAVTVDMIATGTDIKPLECVVFMRSVRSRALFEQMLGRGVRVIPDADLQAVTPDAVTKTHFVVVDAVGVMAAQKRTAPLDRDPSVPLKKLLDLVREGNRDEDVLATLAGRLDRLDRRLSPPQRDQIAAHTDGVPLRRLVADMIDLIDRLDPDGEVEAARAHFGLAPAVAPSAAQLAHAQATLREEAAAPLAYNPALCETILAVHAAFEVVIDGGTQDRLRHARPRPDLTAETLAAQHLVQDFETYCKDNRDQLAALTVLYSQPYSRRLTRAQLMELVAALRLPPRQWTGEALWAAYERVEADRVRGASRGRLLTDLISLARRALGVTPELVSYQDQANARFANWMAQQDNRGRVFSDEQRGVLEQIRDRIVVDLEVRVEDFDETPFAERGGLGRVHALLGAELGAIVDELNRELVA